MTGRNERCPCGSGKKYKKCCMKDSTKGPKVLRVHVGNTPIEQPAKVHYHTWQMMSEFAVAAWVAMNRSGKKKKGFS